MSQTLNLERCQFGFSPAGNRLWRRNLVAPPGQDELYTYDGLSQLLTFQRGALLPQAPALAGASAWAEEFTFDPTGNWNRFVNKSNGQPVLGRKGVG